MPDSEGCAPVPRPVACCAVPARPAGGRRVPPRDVGLRIEDHAVPVGHVGRRQKASQGSDHSAARALERRNGRSLFVAVASVRVPPVGNAAHASAPLRGARAAPAQFIELWRSAQPDRPSPSRKCPGPPRAAAEIPASVRGRVPGHRPGPGGDRLPAGCRRFSRAPNRVLGRFSSSVRL